MSGPTFVNNGVGGNQNFGTSVSLPLPASLVVGNVLIGVVYAGANGSGAGYTWPAGWTEIDHLDIASYSFTYAYHVVTGGDSAPTVTWTPSNAGAGHIRQYTGALTTGPIGNKNQNHGASTTATNAGITTTVDNSLVVDMELLTNNHTTTPPPAGYTNEVVVAIAGFYNQYAAHVAEVSAGSASPAVSQTVSAADVWIDFQFELLSAPPPPKRQYACIVG
jgi:hypothetical protein